MARCRAMDDEKTGHRGRMHGTTIRKYLGVWAAFEQIGEKGRA